VNEEDESNLPIDSEENININEENGKEFDV
jgi:hypothetical protein